MQRITSGCRFPTRTTFADTPAFAGLKCQAENKNHLADGRSAADRWLRGLQQRVLHLLRFQAVQHQTLSQAGEEAKVFSLKVFTFMAELEAIILKERKRRSLPGTVNQVENALFSKEDLQAQKNQEQINQAGVFRPETLVENSFQKVFHTSHAAAGTTQCFPINTGRPIARWRGASSSSQGRQRKRLWQPVQAMEASTSGVRHLWKTATTAFIFHRRN